MLLSGHEDGYVKVWDDRIKDSNPIKIIKAHNKWINELKFHNEGLIFLTTSYD